MRINKEVTLAYYKADSEHAGIIDKLIAFKTNGPYSHVEMVLTINGTQVSYSADSASNKVRKVNHVTDHEMWDYQTVTVSDPYRIYNFYESILGYKYDIVGILGFMIPFKDRSDRWFCSETTANALKIDGFKPMWYLEPSSIDPNTQYRMVKAYNELIL